MTIDGSCCPSLRCNVKELPCSLLITIFSSLPLCDLFRARAVCRLWNTVIVSQEFCGLWKPSHQDKCWVLSEVTYEKVGINPSAYAKLLISRCDDGSEEEEEDEEEEEESKQWLEVWHPSSGVRTRLPRGGLPSLRPPFCSDAASTFKILASAEGLICGAFPASSRNVVYGCSYPSPRYALAVGNPFTQTWRTLPPVRNFPLLPAHTQACALMWVDFNPSSATRSRYRIALFPTSSDYCTILSRTCQRRFWLLVYDSEHDRWERAPNFTWSSSSCLTRTSSPCGVPFLFESYHYYEDNELLGIGVYAMDSRSWNAVVEAMLPMELDDHQWAYMAHRAFPYKGKCILIAVGVKYKSNSLVCTALELDVQGKAFKMLSKMSKELSGKWHAYTPFCELSECPFRLVMEGMFVVVYPWINEEVWPLMAFNMELSKWTRMQKYHPKYSYARTCTLSPSLVAVP